MCDIRFQSTLSALEQEKLELPKHFSEPQSAILDLDIYIRTYRRLSVILISIYVTMK